MKKFYIFLIYFTIFTAFFYGAWSITFDNFDFISHFKDSLLIVKASYGMFVIYAGVMAWGLSKI